MLLSKGEVVGALHIIAEDGAVVVEVHKLEQGAEFQSLLVAGGNIVHVVAVDNGVPGQVVAVAEGVACIGKVAAIEVIIRHAVTVCILAIPGQTLILSIGIALYNLLIDLSAGYSQPAHNIIVDSKGCVDVVQNGLLRLYRITAGGFSDGVGNAGILTAAPVTGAGSQGKHHNAAHSQRNGLTNE